MHGFGSMTQWEDCSKSSDKLLCNIRLPDNAFYKGKMSFFVIFNRQQRGLSAEEERKAFTRAEEEKNERF